MTDWSRPCMSPSGIEAIWMALMTSSIRCIADWMSMSRNPVAIRSPRSDATVRPRSIDAPERTPGPSASCARPSWSVRSATALALDAKFAFRASGLVVNGSCAAPSARPRIMLKRSLPSIRSRLSFETRVASSA